MGMRPWLQGVRKQDTCACSRTTPLNRPRKPADRGTGRAPYCGIVVRVFGRHTTIAGEAERPAALRRYRILDTEPEQRFDDLALLASQICGTPMALISLIDGERQWFKARVGLAVTQTPRDVAFTRRESVVRIH